MAHSLTSSDYDFDVDSTTEQDFSEEEFWQFHMQEWYHRADFGSDSKFDDDGLTKCHLFFQIVAFIELVVVILHLTYQKGGWRPQQFCIVLIFKVEIHIQDQHRSSSWEDASSS